MIAANIAKLSQPGLFSVRRDAGLSLKGSVNSRRGSTSRRREGPPATRRRPRQCPLPAKALPGSLSHLRSASHLEPSRLRLSQCGSPEGRLWPAGLILIVPTIDVDLGIPICPSVRRTGRWDYSTSRMISSFSEAEYLMPRLPGSIDKAIGIAPISFR